MPDALSYEITYQGHTLKTADTAIPPIREPALAMLNGIVDAKGK